MRLGPAARGLARDGREILSPQSGFNCNPLNTEKRIDRNGVRSRIPILPNLTGLSILAADRNPQPSAQKPTSQTASAIEGKQTAIPGPFASGRSTKTNQCFIGKNLLFVYQCASAFPHSNHFCDSIPDGGNIQRSTFIWERCHRSLQAGRAALAGLALRRPRVVPALPWASRHRHRSEATARDR